MSNLNASKQNAVGSMQQTITDFLPAYCLLHTAYRSRVNGGQKSPSYKACADLTSAGVLFQYVERDKSSATVVTARPGVSRRADAWDEEVSSVLQVFSLNARAA